MKQTTSTIITLVSAAQTTTKLQYCSLDCTEFVFIFLYSCIYQLRTMKPTLVSDMHTQQLDKKTHTYLALFLNLTYPHKWSQLVHVCKMLHPKNPAKMNHSYYRFTQYPCIIIFALVIKSQLEERRDLVPRNYILQF